MSLSMAKFDWEWWLPVCTKNNCIDMHIQLTQRDTELGTHLTFICKTPEVCRRDKWICPCNWKIYKVTGRGHSILL